MKKEIFVVIIAFLCVSSLYAQVLLDANGIGDTYELINSVLSPNGNCIEVPDCGHVNFGRHIDEVYDSTLQMYVFRFHIHVSPDNDRCINYDRQRNEIKTYDQSPANLLGNLGETFEYKWKFKIDSNFQSSSSFTHIHQLKGVGGPDEGMPLITLTTRKGNPDKMELRYAAETNQSTIAKVDLAPFKGSWVEASETVKYGDPGEYSISIVKIGSGELLLNYSSSTKKMWKTDADFIRPKWGIYRSLNDSSNLRDEMVYFANFSIKETQPIVIEDTIRPTVILSTDELEPVAKPFTITITFSEAVTGFTESGLTIENGTIQTGSLTSGDNKIFSVVVIPSTSGIVTINIKANVVNDEAGNTNMASNELIVKVLLSSATSASFEDKIQLFPNPTIGMLNIYIKNFNENIKILIFDGTGRTVYQNIMRENSLNLDLSAYEKGIFIIKLEGLNQVFYHKVVLH